MEQPNLLWSKWNYSTLWQGTPDLNHDDVKHRFTHIWGMWSSIKIAVLKDLNKKIQHKASILYETTSETLLWILKYI